MEHSIERMLFVLMLAGLLRLYVGRREETPGDTAAGRILFAIAVIWIFFPLIPRA